MSAKDLTTLASVIVQGIAAVLWIISTFAKVTPAQAIAKFQTLNGTDWEPAQIIVDRQEDFVETSKRQASWNRWAALATGVGVALQAISTAIPTP